MASTCSSNRNTARAHPLRAFNTTDEGYTMARTIQLVPDGTAFPLQPLEADVLGAADHVRAQRLTIKADWLRNTISVAAPDGGFLLRGSRAEPILDEATEVWLRVDDATIGEALAFALRPTIDEWLQRGCL